MKVIESVAGADKGARRLPLAKAVDGEPLFANAHSEASKVAVARDKAEAVKATSIQQVHSVDDHGTVGGVLASGVGELLNRLDRVLKEALLPGPKVRLCPVAINPSDACRAVLGNLGQDACDHLGGNVVAIDEQSKPIRAHSGVQCCLCFPL